MKRTVLVLFVVLALLVPAISVSAATTYYVRPDGDDLNTGLTNDPAGAWLTIQHALDTVAPGDTIQIAAGVYAGDLYLSTDAVTLAGEPGVVIQGADYGIEIDADQATLLDLALEGPAGNDSGGIVVAVGPVNMLWLERCTLSDWDSGLWAWQSITGLKVVDCIFASNQDYGIRLDVTPAGIVDIYGNAFRGNGLAGLLVAGDPLVAEYNAWNHIDGPAAGDAVVGPADADPWTYGALWVEPATQSVISGQPFAAQVRMDTHHLFGVEFDLAFDTSLYELVAEPTWGAFETATDGAVFWTNSVAEANSTGVVSVYGSRGRTDAEHDAADDVLLTLEFEAKWVTTASETGDIQFVDGSEGMAAIGGINIPINSVAGAQVTVIGPTPVTGAVDLQGRSNESGAVADPLVGLSYGYDPAPDTSDEWGDYALEAIVGDTYTVTLEMARYLDASAEVAITSVDQVLATCTLLGGDANDDDVIDIGDISIIGGQYNLVGAEISDVRADINNDDMIDILDMVLAAGNYQLTESHWTP